MADADLHLGIAVVQVLPLCALHEGVCEAEDLQVVQELKPRRPLRSLPQDVCPRLVVLLLLHAELADRLHVEVPLFVEIHRQHSALLTLLLFLFLLLVDRGLLAILVSVVVIIAHLVVVPHVLVVGRGCGSGDVRGVADPHKLLVELEGDLGLLCGLDKVLDNADVLCLAPVALAGLGDVCEDLHGADDLVDEAAEMGRLGGGVAVPVFGDDVEGERGRVTLVDAVLVDVVDEGHDRLDGDARRVESEEPNADGVEVRIDLEQLRGHRTGLLLVDLLAHELAEVAQRACHRVHLVEDEAQALERELDRRQHTHVKVRPGVLLAHEVERAVKVPLDVVVPEEVHRVDRPQQRVRQLLVLRAELPDDPADCLQALLRLLHRLVVLDARQDALQRAHALRGAHPEAVRKAGQHFALLLDFDQLPRLLDHPAHALDVRLQPLEPLRPPEQVHLPHELPAVPLDPLVDLLDVIEPQLPRVEELVEEHAHRLVHLLDLPHVQLLVPLLLRPLDACLLELVLEDVHLLLHNVDHVLDYKPLHPVRHEQPVPLPLQSAQHVLVVPLVPRHSRWAYTYTRDAQRDHRYLLRLLLRLLWKK